MFGPLSCYCCIFGWAFKEFHSHFMVMCYISSIFHRFWLGTCAWTSFPIRCLWNCSKTQQQYPYKLCIDSINTQHDFFRLKVISLSDYVNKTPPANSSCCSYIFGIIWSRRRDQLHTHGILKKLGGSSLSFFLMWIC